MLRRPSRRVMRHLRTHPRFYGAAGAGVLVWIVAARLDPALRLLLAGDAFFVSHLAAIAAVTTSHAAFRERARAGDDGLPVIAGVTAAAIALSLGAAFLLLNHAQSGPFGIAAALASVLLAWLMLHVIAAFHYAHAYYGDRGGRRPPEGGLAFPGGGEPGASEFLYYAFVVGMTAQVSDVQVLSPRMRRLTLAHGVAAFFFNTVILAVTVNAVLALAG